MTGPRIPSLQRLAMGGPHDLDQDAGRPGDFMDDEVDAWHAACPDGGTLRKWLGMTDEEYGRWAVDPACLPDLVAARRLALGLT